MPITGQCFCGQIKYNLSGAIIKTGICHCRDCQRLTGGTSWPFIVVPSNALQIQGNLKELSRTGKSGQKIHMGFCSECGSTLSGRPELWPHIRTLSASSLDDLTLFTPSMHVWVKDAPTWSLLDPNLPKFEQNPS